MENSIHVPYLQFVTPALSPDRIVSYGFEEPNVPVTNASGDGYVAYAWILMDFLFQLWRKVAGPVFDFAYVDLGDQSGRCGRCAQCRAKIAMPLQASRIRRPKKVALDHGIWRIALNAGVNLAIVWKIY